MSRPPFPHTPFEPRRPPALAPPPVGEPSLLRLAVRRSFERNRTGLSLRSINAPPTPEPSPRRPVSLEQSPRWAHPYFRESNKALCRTSLHRHNSLSSFIACSGGAFSRLLAYF